MLARLIALSLKRASLVVVAAGLLLAFAGMRVSSMPVDVFPELNAPTVVVIAESGGLSADEVEMGVTFPIETAMNGLPGLRRVRSSSAPGLSFVWAEFAWGVDIVSIMASLVVALTVTPALCKLLLSRITADGEHHDGALVRFLKRHYEPTLARAITLRKPVLAGAAALTLLALALGATFGRSFLPTFNEGTYTVFLLAPAGTSLDESNRLARGVETRLAQVPGVHSVTRRTGRAERDEHAEPVSSSEIEVALMPEASAADVRREIDAILAGVPGVTTMVGQPIEHRLSHILSGTPAAIAVNVFGDDLALLRSLAKQIETELRSLPGARDVNANREVMVASVPIAFRHADLAAAASRPPPPAAPLTPDRNPPLA